MTRVLPRTHFHTSRLIRILADLTVVDTVEPGAVFAEKLALWVDFADAISLCAVHNSGGASASSRPWSGNYVPGEAMAEELARTRASLESSIANSFRPNAGRSPIQLPIPQPGAPLDDPIPYEPYRRFHQAHQRDMELSVRTLRLKARTATAQASPSLRQLADLDAALDATLAEREKKLLSSVPMLMETRFRHLRHAHQQSLAENQEVDKPDTWMKPGGWLARLCNELQTVLLAELEHRLQPTLGLIEACNDQRLKHA